MFGGLGRSVLDVALFDDAISGSLAGPGSRAAEPGSAYTEAAGREPRRLRIAISTKPAIPGVKPSPESIAAVGRRLGGRALRRSIEREPLLAGRLNRVFDQYDLVLTPTTAAAPPPAEIRAAQRPRPSAGNPLRTITCTRLPTITTRSIEP